MKKSLLATVVLGAGFVFGTVQAAKAATSQTISTASTSGWTVSAGGAVAATPFLSGPNAISITSDGTSAGTPVTGLSLSTFDGFWVADYSFVVPADATNPTITISNYFADDVSILKLNGNIIASTADNGPGTGSIVETDGSQPVSFTFTNGAISNGSGDFVIGGTNTLEAVINNTGGGMAAPLADIGTSNGTNFGVDASVSFNSATTVPLPAGFGCGLATILGIVGLGLLRRRAASR